MNITVTPQKQNELYQKMLRAGIKEEDIDETFVRSSGPGGQNINKVSTCVCLYHRPSGIKVKCQIARSQGLNRFLARQLLWEQIERKRFENLQNEIQRIEKIRRQKRKRSRQAKEKILQNKRHHADKKQNRQKINLTKLNHY